MPTIKACFVKLQKNHPRKQTNQENTHENLMKTYISTRTYAKNPIIKTILRKMESYLKIFVLFRKEKKQGASVVSDPVV